jgi:polyisoprenoid-binding protein YceI
MKMKAILFNLFAVAALVVVSSPVTAADAYKIDPAHSSVEFSVKHMVISNVKGSFDEFEAAIAYDPNNIENSSVEVTIPVKSINTKNEKRDDHLRSADFFDAENHPNITFKSSKIQKKGDGYVAVGTLTMHGVAKEIELPFVLNGPVVNPWGQTVIGIEIEYELDRQDYGLKWNKTMDNGGLVVGDDVKIEINLEAAKS